MKSYLKEGKAKRPEPVLLGQSCERDYFPEFYRVLVLFFFPDNTIFDNCQVTNVSEQLKVFFHFGVDDHDKVRIFFRCLSVRGGPLSG